jgi:hypothetical protein
MPSRPQVFRAHGQRSTEQVRADSEANRGSARERGYRDSHTVFIDGHVAKDASAWRPGQQVNIANPVPYSRKIEAGRIKLSVPSHVYEDAALIIAGRYGNSVSVKFVFMPVRFGDVAAFAAFSQKSRAGRRMSDKARQDWLVRQPALQIIAR